MKLICTSDTHGRHEEINHFPDGDVFIHAGDFSNGGLNFLPKFDKWLGTLPYKHKIVIAGNHDFCAGPLKNAHYLLNESIIIDGIKFYGSPYTPRISNFAFDYLRGSKQAYLNWETIPNDTDVLITHGPAYGIGDKTVRNENVGCEKLFQRLHWIDYTYHIFGHVHEGYGLYANKHANVSAMNYNYELVNPLVELEI